MPAKRCPKCKRFGVDTEGATYGNWVKCNWRDCGFCVKFEEFYEYVPSEEEAKENSKWFPEKGEIPFDEMN